MCYSPEADLLTGLVVGVIAVDAIRHVEHRNDLVLASVPAVLAVHQAIEAVGWWGLQGRVPAGVGDLAVTAYLAIALCIVPLLVPLAVLRSEPDRLRRNVMTPFVILGGVVSILLFASLSAGPVGASIGGRYIAYDVGIIGGGATGLAYGAAVCVPLILSSHKRLVAFGAVNMPVVVGLSLLVSAGLISLWCVWAAVTSVVIAAHVRHPKAPRSTRAAGVAHVGL